MKYFTRAWVHSEAEDGAADAVWPKYRRDIEASFERNVSVIRFATTISLNDAYVDRLTVDHAATELRFLLLTGSLQVGYWRTELIYSGGRIVEGEEILRSALGNRPTEIWYDEFAVDAAGASHAFLLVPGGIHSEREFKIAFDHFEYVQHPASDRLLASADDHSDWG